MVIGNQENTDGTNNGSHPSGIPQDQIDNIMSGIANTGDVKMNNHRKKLRQRFDIIKKLGQGTYGKVQLGINKETGQEVAIKTIKKCKIEAEADLVRIRREVQIMSSVQHPNIIHIYEVFENREKMVLVMEFAAGGELYDYLSERKVLSEEEARRIFRQVATAVYYCHKHKICHRDLKLENILLDENGNAKIADFGLSNVFNEQCLLATFCGSPLYASPEIVEGTPYHGPEVDCWSLGVLLYTLVYGSMPFDGSNFKRLVKQISQGDYYEPKKPSRASSLIREMLTVCPRKRATIEQICSHWWVNENDNVSCLELAEDLANQTPVRLDVLLSLTPVTITADQLVVPSAESGNSAGKSGAIPRSHSVGSIRDVVPNTEAERRILDMVAAGGEAALMPSPTRTITPAQSPLQAKRKLENTKSTDNAASVVLKKKDKPQESTPLSEDKVAQQAELGYSTVNQSVPMETDELLIQEDASSNMGPKESFNFSAKDMAAVGNLCEQLIQDESKAKNEEQVERTTVTTKTTVGQTELEEIPEKTKGATKVIKKFVNKHKTADLVNVIGQIDPDNKKSALKNENTTVKSTSAATGGVQQFVRKCSLQDESPLNKFDTDRRKSRILETAEKFQQMNASNANTSEKNKKVHIAGISVGNFKKEYEKKASAGVSNQEQQTTAGEHRPLEQVATSTIPQELTSSSTEENDTNISESNVETSNSKASVSSFSLEDARRSMENSIALLRQAQTESSKDVNQLCAKTENIRVTDSHNAATATDRERKLMNARAIIGNAIQPASHAAGEPSSAGTMKTTTASITLKSATLPRRKPAKTEIQLDIKPPIVEQPSMRFTTEIQHPISDLRSAPPREGPMPYSPIKSTLSQRASSLEPKEHVIPIQKPPSIYTRTISNTSARSNSLSRQSTNDSESDTSTINMSQSTITGSSQPIKKSPREFIIPIAVEGGGFITPREGSIEPSDSSHTTGTASSRSTFNRLRPTRRIGSLLSESGVDENTPFQKLRTSSTNRDGEDDTRFTLHKLRSSRPVKKISQENDSQSSGEEDDDDGFEILTAENLFSTLLQRVRALTNRMNVNNDITTAFPSSSRLLNNMRQSQNSFWNQEPFGRLNSAALNPPWRHSMSRDLGSDMDSMFSRTGATLPRGKHLLELNKKENVQKNFPGGSSVDEDIDEPLDLADLDLSRLRLSKKDLETLSNIAPELPKCFQEQLLAKLPPTQARKLSRTLSVQTNQNCGSVKIYKRSQSSGRNAPSASNNDVNNYIRDKSLEISSNGIQINAEKSFEFEKKKEATTELTKPRTHTKSIDENDKEAPILQNSDVNEKYKYYSPYVNKTTKDTALKNNTNVCLNTSEIATAGLGTMVGRPPSGRLSPPMPNDSALRRPSQRRISRLMRPDLLEIPQEEPVEESITTQNLIDNKTTIVDNSKATLKSSHHMRNKSLELCADQITNNTKHDTLKSNRRSLSRSRDADDKNNVEKYQLADKILQELQILSSMQSQKKICPDIDTIDNALNEKSAITTVKKVKKIKNKEKSTESSADVDTKTTNNVIKKVRKIVKKTDAMNSATTLIEEKHKGQSEESNNAACVPDVTTSPKKVSKLKRPKSYPMKESISISQTSEMCNKNLTVDTKDLNRSVKTLKEQCSNACNLVVSEINNPSSIAIRESKLLRPKSYPTSKLVPTSSESKKSNQNNNNITLAEESVSCLVPDPYSSMPLSKKNENNILLNASQLARESAASSHSNKKVLKITKKSKLSQPTTSCINTSNAMPTNIITSGNAVEDSNDLCPSAAAAASASAFNIKTKEKTTEKKTNKGLLYAIGQKFEKLRASATSNSCTNTPTQKKSSVDNISPEKTNNKLPIEIKKTKSLGNNTTTSGAISASTKTDNCVEKKSGEISCIAATKPIKSEKRSRIDAMIRNLRERSVPRSQSNLPSESNYIKRAVSVEDMPGTFHKKSVNRMLGFFKRYDKAATSENRVRTTRSTSNIERHVANTSPIYQNANVIVKQNDKVVAASSSGEHAFKVVNSQRPIKTCKEEVTSKYDIILPSVSLPKPTMLTLANSSCPDCCCIELTDKTHNLSFSEIKNHHQQGNQEKRKGLTLELLRTDKKQNVSSGYGNIRPSKNYTCYNDNEIYSNISQYNRSVQSSSGNGSNILTIDNASNNNISSIINNNTNSNSNSNNNNNSNSNNIHSSSLHTSQTSGYRTSSTYEMNQNNNLISPSFENIGNYSSDSRSFQEDCASTSTFLSPTEEAELCFDNWSICSEDNYRRQHATPSPTVSRLSRASQASSPTRRGGDSSETNESVVDRIKRRSFYCRFNEKKPKRTSSIVGPNSVREYYREKGLTSKTRSSTKIASTEREHSPDITQEFFRPLKLSPIGTELKPPIYRSSFNTTHTDYTSATGKPRKSLNDIRAPPSPSCLSERRHCSFVNTDKDLLTNSSSIFPSRYKFNAHDEVNRSSCVPTNSYYNTYNPKRRYSFTTNTSSSTSGPALNIANSSQIDGYATMGRRPIRTYDHRTMSLLDPPNYSTTSYRHDTGSTPSTATAAAASRDYTISLSRSNSRYRKSSTPRSPNNI